MKSARMSCGTLESRKMLKVLRSAIQNCGWVRIADVLVEADEGARCCATRSQSWSEIDGGVGDREEPDDDEEDEERRDVEVGRELEVPAAEAAG